MKTRIDVAHVHLLVKRKLKQINITTTKDLEISHNWQLGKKKVASSRFTITTFFGSTNLYKHGDEAQ
jgi:hypothetical protein